MQARDFWADDVAGILEFASGLHDYLGREDNKVRHKSQGELVSGMI